METLPHIFHGFGMRNGKVPDGIVFPFQVHQTSIVFLDAPPRRDWHEEADAVVTTVPDLPVGVRTADCLPILLTDKTGTFVGAVHAGWRGTVLGILPKVLVFLKDQLKIPGEDVIIAIGPGIGSCCLEVDNPVREEFEKNGLEKVWDLYARTGRKSHWHLDIKAINQHQALQAGVKQSRIDVLPYCTSCDEDYFYSYRKEGLAAGRQVSYIMLKQ
jgi:YfiH family protein